MLYHPFRYCKDTDNEFSFLSLISSMSLEDQQEDGCARTPEAHVLASEKKVSAPPDGRCPFKFILVSYFLFSIEPLTPFPPSFRLHRNPILPRAGLLPFKRSTDQEHTSMGGRCSSARSLAGRRFSCGLVGRGRTSEGTCRIFGGRRRALADSPPRDRWPGGLGTSSLLYLS